MCACSAYICTVNKICELIFYIFFLYLQNKSRLFTHTHKKSEYTMQSRIQKQHKSTYLHNFTYTLVSDDSKILVFNFPISMKNSNGSKLSDNEGTDSFLRSRVEMYSQTHVTRTFPIIAS